MIKIVEPKRRELITRLHEIRGLHGADVHTIALTKEYDGMALMDDQLARKTARIYKVRYSGTPYLLMRAHIQGLIAKELVKKAVDDMIYAGWRCGVEDYQSIMRYLEGFGHSSRWPQLRRRDLVVFTASTSKSIGSHGSTANYLITYSRAIGKDSRMM